MLLYLCILGMSALNIAMLFAWGKPDWKPVLVAYLGLMLQGGCLLAIGEFISTLTKNQIIAGGVTFFVCLLLWVLSWSTAFDSGATSQVINYLPSSPTSRISPRACSTPRTWSSTCRMIFFALFLTSRSMESLRWRANMAANMAQSTTNQVRRLRRGLYPGDPGHSGGGEFSRPTATTNPTTPPRTSSTAFPTRPSRSSRA